MLSCCVVIQTWTVVTMLHNEKNSYIYFNLFRVKNLNFFIFLIVECAKIPVPVITSSL